MKDCIVRKKAMNEITNKIEMIDYIEQGISGDIYKKFGVYKVDFRPFEEKRTREYERLVDFANGGESEEDDDDVISVTREDLSDAIQANISTVFHGMRFYFKNHEDLKKFCKIVETSGEYKV